MSRYPFSSPVLLSHVFFLFFFNDTATTEISTLSLHDALPILGQGPGHQQERPGRGRRDPAGPHLDLRSEEHTSELQSLTNLECRLMRSKKHKYELQKFTNIVYRLLPNKMIYNATT